MSSSTTRVKQTAESVTQAQSHTLVKNLIRTAISSICYFRNLFDEDVFKTKKLAGLDVKTLRGDKAKDAGLIIRWMERGVFEAIQRKYLDTLIFAVYEPGAEHGDKAKLLECYSFKVRYANEDGDNDNDNDGGGGSIEMTCEGTSGDDGAAKQELHHQQHSKTEIKRATVAMIRTLITLAPCLSTIPDTRYLSMRLLYRDDVTPADYEPEFFKSPDDDDDDEDGGGRMYFTEQPETVDVGSVKTSYHDLRLKVKYLNKDIDSSQSSSDTNEADEGGSQKYDVDDDDYDVDEAMAGADEATQQLEAEEHATSVIGVNDHDIVDANVAAQKQEEAEQSERADALVTEMLDHFAQQNIDASQDNEHEFSDARSSGEDEDDDDFDTNTNNGHSTKKKKKKKKTATNGGSDDADIVERYYESVQCLILTRQNTTGTTVTTSTARALINSKFPQLTYANVTMLIDALVRKRVVSQNSSNDNESKDGLDNDGTDGTDPTSYAAVKRFVLDSKIVAIGKLTTLLKLERDIVRGYLNRMMTDDGVLTKDSRGRFKLAPTTTAAVAAAFTLCSSSSSISSAAAVNVVTATTDDVPAVNYDDDDDTQKTQTQPLMESVSLPEPKPEPQKLHGPLPSAQYMRADSNKENCGPPDGGQHVGDVSDKKIFGHQRKFDKSSGTAPKKSNKKSKKKNAKSSPTTLPPPTTGNNRRKRKATKQIEEEWIDSQASDVWSGQHGGGGGYGDGDGSNVRRVIRRKTSVIANPIRQSLRLAYR